MKHIRTLVIIFLALLLSAGMASAVASGEQRKKEDTLAEVKAFVDKSTITIGEKVRYTLQVVVGKDLEVEFPYGGSNFGGFVVKGFGSEDIKPLGRDRKRYTQWYELDTYTVGPYVVPEQKIMIIMPDGKTEYVQSSKIFIDVKSVVGDGSEDEGIKDIKGPVNVPINNTFLFVLAGIILLAVIIVSVGWFFYKKIYQPKTEEIILPPHIIALNELSRIGSMSLLSEHKVKEFYYMVSNCMRTYIENRFNIKAPEQTTEEFLDYSISSGKMESRYIDMLKDYLIHCDLVKYAKLEPDENQCNDLMERTRSFIEDTMPKVEPEDNKDSNDKGARKQLGAGDLFIEDFKEV